MVIAEASDKSPSSDGDCPLCHGSGALSWEQPQPSGVLRTIEMPCPHGCGGEWKHPNAERDRVVEERPEDEGSPARVEGNVDEANRIGAEFIRGALENWGFLEDNQDGPK